jgi:hypothetical protein
VIMTRTAAAGWVVSWTNHDLLSLD